jgi:hypothetical protein
MADPEMPTTGDTPAPPAPPEPAPQNATDAAIQEKGPAGRPPPATSVTGEAPATPAAEAKPRRRPSPEILTGRVRVLDRLLVGLVLVLAFFLGAFAIQNSDFWMHLATGDRISRGDVTLGVDPFSYTTDGVTWVNHAWLFDWLLFHFYQAVGPAGLVAFRGLLFAVLALVLLRIREAGQSLWLPAVCVTLALLTASTRLLFQPVMLSFVFFALTLYLIHRALRGRAFSLRGRSFSPLWLLPPLFALWVNLDSWFILGPLTVGLFLLGAGAQRLTASPGVATPGPAADVRTLGLVLVVGLAACLANPYLHRAFTLPLELAYPLADVLPEGMVSAGVAARRVNAVVPQVFPIIPAFPEIAFSPFPEVSWRYPGFGLNSVAGAAYYPLLLLGLVSFALLVVVRPRGEPGARRFPAGLFLAWLPLTLLSAFNVRAVGLFAVVAAPAVALNFAELSRRRPAGELTWGQWNWAIAGRLGTALGCLALLLLAWPGWLHAGPDDPWRSHRVRFDVYTDPSLEKAAGSLKELLAGGKLRHGFNVSWDAANYFAWYAGPDARTFFDQRLALPPEAAADYARLRKALRESTAVAFSLRPPSAGQRPMDEVERLFRAYQINYLVVTNVHANLEAQQIANRLALEPLRWARLYADGRTAVFGWRDPRQRGDPFADLVLDRERMAFGKVPEAGRAPPQGTVPPDGPPNLWQRYVAGKPPAPLAMSKALSYFIDYRLFSPQSPRWQIPVFQAGQLLGPLGAPGTAAVGPAELPAVGSALLAWTPAYQQGFTQAMRANPPGPPALPVLAVRAARRAVAEDPAGAGNYATLADAYWVTWSGQERHLGYADVDTKGAFDSKATLTRQTMRHVQYLTALSQAARLHPDNVELHVRLSQLFEEMGFVDAAYEHAALAKEQFAAARPPRGFEKEAETQAKLLEKRALDLKDEVDRRRDLYEQDVYGQRSLWEKVKAALFKSTRLPVKGGAVEVPRGLAKLAMKLMAEADASALPKQEQPRVADLQIRLTLFLGKAQDLRETAFDTDSKRRLRPILGPRYDDYETLYAAALGHYREADQLLADRELPPLLATKFARQLHDLTKRAGAEHELQKRVALLTQAAPPDLPLRLSLAGQVIVSAKRLEVLVPEVGKIFGAVQGTAELRALRGLLALEQGDNARAVEQFRESLNLAGPMPSLFPSQPIVVRYLRLMEKYW